jgi:hypothetical protein
MKQKEIYEIGDILLLESGFVGCVVDIDMSKSVFNQIMYGLKREDYDTIMYCGHPEVRGVIGKDVDAVAILSHINNPNLREKRFSCFYMKRAITGLESISKKLDDLNDTITEEMSWFKGVL